jgi:hypothetical protein
MSAAAAAQDIAPIGVTAPAVSRAGPDDLAHLRGCETSRGRRHCDGSHPQL